MATEMQKRFSRSMLWKRFMYRAMTLEGMPPLHHRRLFNKLFREMAEQMPEPQIKLFLYELVQCEELEPEEMAAAHKLLMLSQTTLTTAQSNYFYDRMYE